MFTANMESDMTVEPIKDIFGNPHETLANYIETSHI